MIIALTVCLLTRQGLIADGLLAWRFMVIFGRAKWALYLPVIAVVVNAREQTISSHKLHAHVVLQC